MNRPTCWILKEQLRRDSTGSVPLDYTAAYKYGDIEFITELDFPIYGRGSAAAQWGGAVEKFLNKYDPIRDWLVLTGSPLSIFLLGLRLGNAEITPRILVWRRDSNEYVPLELNIESVIEK